jgi:hypothetical protein
MSGTSIPQNVVPNEPTLSDLLNLLKKEIFLDMNCVHVGTIQSFNSSNQTVSASINYQKTLFQLNSTTGLYQPVLETYPTTVNCPLVVLRGGTVSMTFPIAVGDECLLLFNDRDIDNWFTSGATTQGNATGRLHAFSDAIALVGVKSTPNVLTAYDTVRALLTNGNVAIGVNPSTNKVRIANTSIGTLNSLLQNILTQIKNLVTACAAITVTGVTTGSGVSGVPVNAATITAISTQLTTYATELGNLLE